PGHHDRDGCGHAVRPDPAGSRAFQSIRDGQTAAQRQSRGPRAVPEILLRSLRDTFIVHGPMRTPTAVANRDSMEHIAGWGSQDIPSGSYPGTPRSPVRHPEIDGSKGPAGPASGSERPSPAIDRGGARRSSNDPGGEPMSESQSAKIRWIAAAAIGTACSLIPTTYLASSMA